MVSKLLPCLVLLVLAGCATGDHVQLDERWSPLTRLQESSTTSPDVFRTIAPILYCNKISDLTKKPLVQQEALLMHEQLHATRQLQKGLAWWLANYVVSREFRWEEESLSWALEVRFLIKNNFVLDVPRCATFLSGDTYSILGVHMVSYDEAVAFLNDVIAGSH